jgi:hypothetical protein
MKFNVVLICMDTASFTIVFAIPVKITFILAEYCHIWFNQWQKYFTFRVALLESHEESRLQPEQLYIGLLKMKTY